MDRPNTNPVTPNPDGPEVFYVAQEPQQMLAESLRLAIGYYVICEFLIGTQMLETRAGLLHTVGTNYLTLYQPNVDRYVICDFYSLKFISIYNTKEVPPNAPNGSNSWNSSTGSNGRNGSRTR